MNRILLATSAAIRELTEEDQLLASSLRELGFECSPYIWGAAFENQSTDVVVIRSTWDYHRRFDEFIAWLDELDALGITAFNPTDMLRWNAHKGYLTELQQQGIDIVPTEVVRQGSNAQLSEILSSRGWEDAIVKPAVSASADGTWKARQDPNSQERFANQLAAEDLLVQPFLREIGLNGEWSVVMIDGVFSHAALKRTADDDWRVQAEFGGVALPAQPPTSLLAFAANLVGRLDSTPLYARIDVVEADGLWRLAELELIEPQLFLDFAPDAPAKMARAIAARLG